MIFPYIGNKSKIFTFPTSIQTFIKGPRQFTKARKYNKRHTNLKEVKLFEFMYDMTVYVEKSKAPNKMIY